MKGLILLMLILLFTACTGQKPNPFLSQYNTPFGLPPFNEIKEEHYLQAFKTGIAEQEAEIKVITENPGTPTFDNTILAMEKSGEILERVSNVFFNMTSANTSDSLQNIAREVSPLLSAHQDNIRMNEKLFARIKTLHEQKDQLALNPEQARVLDEYYLDFVRGGAALDSAAQVEFRKINEELALLSLKFGDNILAETNRFELVIENQTDLAGLPENVISEAAAVAAERNQAGKWIFTLHNPSRIPVLQYAQNRTLREKIFRGYIEMGNHNDSLDTKALTSRIAALRVRRANLLGYKTHADFILDRNMAKTPPTVYDFLGELWQAALPNAKKEAAELQKMIDEEGGNFKLAAWDWWYYAEKLRTKKYAFDEEMLRPYFQMQNVRAGVFTVASQLYGITFTKLDNIAVYHPDVEVFEVKEANGQHIGILLTDYFPRESKRGGAWMNEFRAQSKLDGKDISPVIVNVGNFSKPVGDKPALLSIDETLTMFHEFGHALHGLLSNRTYPRITGTSVSRDFVELPSQIMENWALEPQVLKIYARHYQTGQIIPDELVEKIRQAAKFNQGFATVEYLSAALLDMDWHTLETSSEQDVNAFENASMMRIGMIPEIVVRYRSPYFRHIFSGGYSAGYYSYIWAEVLDADAFQAFKEHGLFNPEYAKAFRENVLSAGNSEDPMILYKRFRGADPSKEPLLRKRGLL